LDADGDGDFDPACGGTDCDDADASVYPGAIEIPGNGIDEDCDGVELCYLDADDDGWRPDGTSTVASANLSCEDAGEATASDPTGDCDDTDAAVNPGVPEICGNGIDDDCDGTVDCDDS
jgi:hypothetical protein